jgi:hypothetical protein
VQAAGHWSDSQDVAYRTGRSILTLTIGFGLLLAVIAIARPDRPVRPRLRTLTDGELVTVGRQSTVVLTSGPCQGAAFFITPELLLTNAHVVCAEMADAHVGARMVPAAIVQIDDELDVALLRAEGAGGTPLRLADVMGVRPGDRVAAAGAPGGREVSVVAGVVTLPLTRIWGVLHIEAYAALSQGNSGGPLLDAHGQAIGVISKRRAGGGRPVALALPLDYLAAWLPAGLAVEGAGWDDRAAEAARGADEDLEHFRPALRGPLLLGAHFMRYARSSLGTATPEQALVFVVAAPASASRPALTQLTVRLTCGDTSPRMTALSPWLPIGRPVERSSMLDVTQLRPFLSWARKRSLADGLALATGIASVTPALVCPTGQLALVDGGAVTSTVAIE